MGGYNKIYVSKRSCGKMEIWHRNILALCAERRIRSTERVGNMWIIPADAKKPADELFMSFKRKKKQ